MTGRNRPPDRLPAEIRDHPEVVGACRDWNIGRLFRLVNNLSEEPARFTVTHLGRVCGLSVSRVGAYMNDAHQVISAGVIERVADGLRIPGERFGFIPRWWENTTTTPTENTSHGSAVAGQRHRDTVQEVEFMLRRNFVVAVTAATVGMGVAGLGLDFDRLDALLPDVGQEPPPRRIGASDVAAINQATDTFRASHHERGGGLARAAAVAQVGYVLNLRESECSEQVRAELLLATAALANTAGWMSCQAGRHQDAKRLWMIALTNAREAEHPHSGDLMVEIVMNTAHQALHLDEPQEAVSLAAHATALTTTATAPVSATTRAFVPDYLAWGQATLGQAQECRRALEEAGQIFADADPVDAPPWSSRLDAASYAGWRGRVLSRLSVSDPGCAPEAIEHLRTALDAYGPGRDAIRATTLPALAGSYVQAGDLDTALSLGHESVTLAESVHSVIPHSWLRTLDKVLQPHHQRPEVTELRRRIHQATAPTPA